MLDKYFGFLKVRDEESILESLLEHARIDEEEIFLLQKMVSFLCENKPDEIKDIYLKIRKINEDTKRIFENTAEQIIQANFDHQKQYDLLRLHQRIESISGHIIATAKRIVILIRIGGKLPEKLNESVSNLALSVTDIHTRFKDALNQYIQDKKKVIRMIHQIEEKESDIDHLRSLCLECLYELGNVGDLPQGNFRAIENIIEHLESTSDMIEEAATSLEWLLIY